MGNSFSKILNGPFDLSHAALISIVAHFMFFSTQPFAFSSNPPVVEKKYKKIRLEVIKKPKVIPAPKKALEVKKPVLRKMNKPIVAKPVSIPVSNPVKQIISQPVPVRSTVVPVANRTPQKPLASAPTARKIQTGSFLTKGMSTRFKVSAISSTSPVRFAESENTRVTKFESAGSGISFSREQIQPRVAKGKIASLQAQGNSHFVATHGVLDRSFMPRAISVAMLAPEPQEVPVSAEELKELWAGYTSTVRKMIAQAKIYPPAARDKGQQGKINLTFKLGKQGEVLKLLIEHSSGHNILDEAARNAVRNAGPFPPIPEKLNKQYVLLKLPVSFILR